MAYEYKPYKMKSWKLLLEEAVADESTAGETYRYMADISPTAEVAEQLRAIAADEDRHHSIVSSILAGQQPQIEKITRLHEHIKRMREGGFMPTPQPRPEDYRTTGDIEYPPIMHEQEPAHRPIPYTDAEWVDLGYDIEAKIPNRTQMQSNEIRHQVAVATYNTEGDAEVGDADDAKRWLLAKANEVGVD